MKKKGISRADNGDVRLSSNDYEIPCKLGRTGIEYKKWDKEKTK